MARLESALAASGLAGRPADRTTLASPAPAVRPRGVVEDALAPESLRTWANLVTWVRVGVCLACFGIAAARRDPVWNGAGLIIHWLLDSLDGFLARALRQETRIGAQLDIIADRVLVVFFYHNYVVLHPEALVAAGLFLVNFCGLDLYLSIQFLRWPILSPNYFHLVDRRIWALTWSPAAKGLGTGLPTAIIALTGAVQAAAILCAGLIAVRVYSIVRLHRIRWCEGGGPG